MPPAYIDGKMPYLGLTSVDASVSLTTPYLQHGTGDKSLAVPAPAVNDTLAVLTSTQTMSCKTLLSPTITSPNITSPVVVGGSITSANFIMSGVQMSGGIVHNTILGNRTVVTLPAGATKTLDFSTADMFFVSLTGPCTLTISNASTGKMYQVVVQQNIADSYTTMSWMTGFINQMIASGPTQSTAAVDFWTVTFDGTYHYGLGAKNVQG